MKKVITIIVFSATLLLCSCASKLFYHPNRILYQTPSRQNLKYKEVAFKSKDGTKLFGWFIPAEGKALGTVIHFHGNAQNMSAHFSYVDWIPKEGFNLFAFDYRGYGKSEGKPNKRGLFEDSIAAIEYVQSRKDVDPERILILGQSLGGANAISATGNKKTAGIKAIAIDSTFFSYQQIARDKLANIPVISLLRWPLSFILTGNKYSAGHVVDKIAPTPLLLIHGTFDSVISEKHSQKLFKKAKSPKQLWIIPGARHAEAFVLDDKDYRRKLIEFYKDALKNKPE